METNFQGRKSIRVPDVFPYRSSRASWIPSSSKNLTRDRRRVLLFEAAMFLPLAIGNHQRLQLGLADRTCISCAFPSRAPFIQRGRGTSRRDSNRTRWLLICVQRQFPQGIARGTLQIINERVCARDIRSSLVVVPRFHPFVVSQCCGLLPRGQWDRKVGVGVGNTN